MALDDLVTYNGIQMRRDYAESLRKSQLTTHYRTNGSFVLRIRSGSETPPMTKHTAGLCICCSASDGQFHEPLCEREQCPICKQQVMSCDCGIFTDDAVVPNLADPT